MVGNLEHFPAKELCSRLLQCEFHEGPDVAEDRVQISAVHVNAAEVEQLFTNRPSKRAYLQLMHHVRCVCSGLQSLFLRPKHDVQLLEKCFTCALSISVGKQRLSTTLISTRRSSKTSASIPQASHLRTEIHNKNCRAA